MGKSKGAVGAMTTGENPGITPPKKGAGVKATKMSPKSGTPKPRTKAAIAKTR